MITSCIARSAWLMPLAGSYVPLRGRTRPPLLRTILELDHLGLRPTDQLAHGSFEAVERELAAATLVGVHQEPAERSDTDHRTYLHWILSVLVFSTIFTQTAYRFSGARLLGKPRARVGPVPSVYGS